MKTLVVDNHSDLIHELERLAPGEVTVVDREHFRVGEEIGYDLVILSGSNGGFPVQDHLDDLIPEVHLVQQGDIPVIGICYGSQVIAAAYSGRLERMPELHEGMATVQLADQFDFSGRSVTVYEYHGWRVVDLPNEFEVLGRSDHAIEIFHHREKPLWGLQFHPEHLCDDTLGDEVFAKVLEEIIFR